MLETDPVRDTFGPGAFVGLLHELGIDVDPPAPQPGVHARGRQRDQTVSGSEVHHDIIVTECGHA